MKTKMNKTKLLYVLLLVVTSAFSQGDFREGNFYYKINGSTTVTLFDVVDGLAVSTGGVLTIPKEVTEDNITYTVNTIGRGVFDIGSGAPDNQRFTELNLPSSIRTIEELAFRHNRIKNLVLPNSVRTIEASAFRDNEMETIQYSRSDNGDITTSNNGNLNFIGASAFRNNKLRDITLTKNVQTIIAAAFVENPITDIRLSGIEPPNATSGDAFSNRQDIRLNVPEGSVDTYRANGQWDGFFAINGTFIGGVGSTGSRRQIIYRFIETGTNKVNIAGVGPNFGTTDLTINETVVVNGLECTVINIEAKAFEGKIMNSVTINSSSLEAIGSDAFRNTKIKELTFGSNVTGLKRISNDAFNGSELTSITIPESVTDIFDGAFRNGTLTDIRLSRIEPPTVNSGAFNNRSDIRLIVPEESFNAYKDHPEWGKSFSINGTYISDEGRTESRGQIIYEFIETGTNKVHIRGVGPNFRTTDLTINETVVVKGLECTIINIEAEAFLNKIMNSVILNGSSLEAIGSDAFRNTKIKELTFGSNVTGLKRISKNAFNGSELTSITIPESVTDIFDGAFRNGTLTDIRLSRIEPPTVNSGAFNNRSDIRLIVPENSFDAYKKHPEWGKSFSINGTYISDEGRTESRGQIIYRFIETGTNKVNIKGAGPNFRTTDLTINETVVVNGLECTIINIEAGAFLNKIMNSVTLNGSSLEAIGSNAFRNTKIKELTFGSNVTGLKRISRDAFNGSELTSITIPESVTDIFAGAFRNGTLTDIRLSRIEPPTVNSGAFNNRRDIRLIVPEDSVNKYKEDAQWGKSFSINGNYIGEQRDALIGNFLYRLQPQKNEVTVIGSSITERAISVPGRISFNSLAFDVTTIAVKALDGGNFPSVTIGNGIRDIKNSAFRNSKIGILSLPESLITIEESAFRDNFINNITLPSGLETIGNFVFEGNSITKVTSENRTPPSLEVNSFGEDRSEIDLFVPLGTKDDYTGNRWTGFKNNIEEINVQVVGFKFIVDNFSYEITSLSPAEVSVKGVNSSSENLDINDSVSFNGTVYNITSVGGLAFIEKRFTSINLPTNLQSIGTSAFRGNQLTSIDLPTNLLSIGALAFAENPITEVTSFNTKPPRIVGSSFRNRDQIILNVPQGTRQAYIAKGWTNFAEIREFEIDIIIASKVFLQGASINPNAGEEGLMRDDLRVGDIPTIPIESPYEDSLTVDSTVFETTGANAIVDWVFVELRIEADNENTTIVNSMSALLQRDGDIVDTDGISPLSFTVAPGDYFMAINHRNHLGVISANTVTVALSGATIAVDFTNPTLVQGGTTALTEVNGIFTMIGGDPSEDGQVLSTDITEVVSEIGSSGYRNADLDMNGQVLSTDVIIGNQNIGRGQQFSTEITE